MSGGAVLCGCRGYSRYSSKATAPDAKVSRKGLPMPNLGELYQADRLCSGSASTLLGNRTIPRSWGSLRHQYSCRNYGSDSYADGLPQRPFPLPAYFSLKQRDAKENLVDNRDCRYRDGFSSRPSQINQRISDRY